MSLSPQQRQRLQELAAEAQEILCDDKKTDSHPMTFAQLEDACIEASDFMATLMMEAEIEKRPPPETNACCPTCGRAGALQAEQEARVLQTDRGEVTWLESTYYCRRCRRSFFPSDA